MLTRKKEKKGLESSQATKSPLNQTATNGVANPQPTTENEIEDEPTQEEFYIPTTKAAYKSMVERLKTVGLSKGKADKAIKTITMAFNGACREYKNKIAEKKKQEGTNQHCVHKAAELKTMNNECHKQYS